MTVKKNKPFSTFINSFQFALRGIYFLIRDNRNAQIELVIAIITICCGLFFQIHVNEWLIIFTLIGIVLSAEGFNSVIETLADRIHPEQDAWIGKAKDMAAGSVLIISFVAAIEGFIIFAPYFLNIFMK